MTAETEASMTDSLLNVDDTLRKVPLSKRAIYDPAFRARVGLPSVKVGRRLLFSARALDCWIAQQVDHAR
jgi:hypothetical protein